MGALSSGRIPFTMSLRSDHIVHVPPCHPAGAWLCALLLGAAIWAGCGSAQKAEPSKRADSTWAASARDTTLTDALGREVTLRVPVLGLAPLAPSVTETIALVAGRKALVGVTDADTWPPGIADLPTYQVLPVDFEQIAMLRPDLVLASTQVNTPRDARAFEALGIPVIYLAGANLEDVLGGVRLVGELTGRRGRARTVTDSLQARLRALTDQTRMLESQPNAVFLISTGTPWSFGPESYMHEVMSWAGLASITRSFANEAPVLTDEFLIERAPEVIVGPFDSDIDARAEILAAHPLWRTVPAVHNGRVISVPADLVLRPGPRMIEGAWVMARGAHPQLFEQQP